jgi:hypothetical protein
MKDERQPDYENIPTYLIGLFLIDIARYDIASAAASGADPDHLIHGIDEVQPVPGSPV